MSETPGIHKPRSNVNHFGGSLGGPIVHDKLFFFFDSEWVRIALPIFTTATLPSAAFQQYVLTSAFLRRRSCRSTEDVFAVRKHQRNASCCARLSVRCRMAL